MRTLGWAIVLAGCSKAAAPVPIVNRIAETAGCPSARDVYLATYHAPRAADDRSTDVGGQVRRPSWLLPLSVQSTGGGENHPAFRTLTAAEARAANVPAAPTDLWLLRPEGPCRATVGSYYVARGFDESLMYGVELGGCAVPAASASAIAVTSATKPACSALAPTEVAYRNSGAAEHVDPATGETTSLWVPPDEKTTTPLPPDLAATIPAHDCQSPACEPLWKFSAVKSRDREVVWIGAVYWLAVGADKTYDKACGWTGDGIANVFVRGADGTPVEVFDTRDDGGMVLQAMVLESVLVDDTGAKVLVFHYPDRYTTFDVTATGATQRREVTYARPHPESFGFSVFQLGPYCGF